MASVAGRYASALFELANEQGQLAQVEGDLSRFQQLMDASTDLRQLVRSPVISGDEQRKALQAVLARAGIGGLVSSFLGTVAGNRRLFAMPDMLKAFRAIAARHRGEVAAEVASAQPLSEDQLTQIKDTLRVQVGKDVQLTTKVDPALLGGLVVKIGSRMIDSSLRTKLNSLKTLMKEVS